MSALDAFYSTWDQARNTFGSGVPQTGTEFDRSSQLRDMQSAVQAATPDSRWQGSAADAYTAKNQKHAAVYGKLADLDQRMAAEVDRSAAVVTAGRQNLDQVRDWVTSAAASAPNDKSGEYVKLAIASKGISQISNIIQQSNSEMSAIGERVRGIGKEYDEIGGDKKKKFDALGERKENGPGDGSDGLDNKKIGPDGKPEVDPAQAEHDVHQALGGQATPEELTRIRGALTLSPEQQADLKAGRPVNLTPQQKQVLGQVQAQTHGMSVDDVRRAEQRLGSDGHLISDSLQMMSNKQFDFAKVPLEPGALGSLTETSHGGASQLPESVQKTLNKDLPFWDRNFDKVDSYTQNARDVATIADIVRDGNPAFQHGTDLDKKMLDWTADSLENPLHKVLVDNTIPGLGSDFDGYVTAKEDALDKIFYAAGQDHLAVGSELKGDSGQHFLDALHTYEWNDPRHSGSTHGLLDWIGTDAVSPDIAIATNSGESAHALATYLDSHAQQLLKHDTPFGHNAIGNYDPALVSADATALAPFQRAMMGDLSGTHGFGDFGHPSTGDFSAARNVFAVIDSDPGSAKMFNAVAEQNILNYQNNFANAAASDPGMNSNSPHFDDLRHAANLLGVVNGGADAEATSRGLNDDEHAKAVYDIKKNALDLVLSGGLNEVPGISQVPGINIAQEAVEVGILGDTPEHVAATHQIPTNTVQQGLDMSAYKVAAALHVQPGDIDSQFFQDDGHLKSPDQVVGEENKIKYSEQLQRYIDHHSDLGLAMNRFENQYNHGAGINVGKSDDNTPPHG